VILCTVFSSSLTTRCRYIFWKLQILDSAFRARMCDAKSLWPDRWGEGWDCEAEDHERPARRGGDCGACPSIPWWTPMSKNRLSKGCSSELIMSRECVVRA
jgi:hypothetical protein